MNIPNGFKLVPVDLTDEMRDVIRGGGYSEHLYSNLLAAAPTPPQPIYDEAKERELFESFQVDEGGNIDFENGYYENGFVQSAWDGWKACAKSRAKSVEVSHE